MPLLNLYMITWSDVMSAVKEVLAHPLLLLLLGAILTGLVIPRVTRGWHTHQKALEIKTELVSELSKAIMEMIMAVQYARLGAVGQTQADFDAAYSKWEIASSVIGTKLHAYFPQTLIPATWEGFAEQVTDFYAIEGVPLNERSKFESELWKKLRQSGSLPDGAAGWLELKNAILRRKGQILQSILEAEISVLH